MTLPTIRCLYCSEQNPRNARVCKSCGGPLPGDKTEDEEVAQATAAASVPPPAPSPKTAPARSLKAATPAPAAEPEGEEDGDEDELPIGIPLDHLIRKVAPLEETGRVAKRDAIPGVSGRRGARSSPPAAPGEASASAARFPAGRGPRRAPEPEPEEAEEAKEAETEAPERAQPAAAAARPEGPAAASRSEAGARSARAEAPAEAAAAGPRRGFLEIAEGARKIQVSTTAFLEGWAIREYLGALIAQEIAGSDVLAELRAGRGRVYQEKLEFVWMEAVGRLKFKAAELGATCVVGMATQLVTLESGGEAWLMVTVTGTAARAEPIR